MQLIAQDKKVSIHSPWSELPEKFRDQVLHGTKGFKGDLSLVGPRTTGVRQ